MKSTAITNSVFLLIGALIGALVTVYIVNSLSFSGVPSDTESRLVTNIAPAEASAMLNKYQDQLFNKLKVNTEGDGTKFIETFIIQDSIFTKLKSLTENSHPEERFEGIALSLAINEFGATTVVSALINGGGNGIYKHLIPNSNLDPRMREQYFYDHIDICPNMCPENQADLFKME